jgi:hypothetical protein
MKAEATVLDELVDEVTLLVDWLKKDAPRGSAARELLHGLMRDLWVLEQASKQDDATDDAAWLEPFVDAAGAKLEVAARLLPAHARRVKETIDKVAGLRARGDLLAQLRRAAGPVLDALAPEARAALQRGGVEDALRSTRLLRRAPGAADPELALAARLLEGLGRHLALGAKSGELVADGPVHALAQRLEGWLEERGAALARPAAGGPAPKDVVSVVSATRVAGRGQGQVVAVASPGVTLGDAALARAVVVTSPGAESHLLAAVRQLVEATTADAQDELGPVLGGLGRAYRERLDDTGSAAKDRAEAALDLLLAVRNVFDTPQALTPLLEALARDFDGAKAELILPVPRTQKPEDPSIEGSDVFSDDVPPGEIVSLLRPGLKLGGEVVRPALVRVSQGSPPPGIIDEVLELLPQGDARADHIRARIERARRLAAGDAGALQARELADLALQLKDDVLGEAARRALRLVVDEPPQQLSGRSGWEAVREFLDENLETLLQDGDQGVVAALRLVRPYLQGLRTGQVHGARLRSLGESMEALLRLFDEQMAATARTWLFGELERLGSEGYPKGGNARRLVRTAAKALKAFYQNGETTSAVELTSAMKAAGIQVYPDDGEKVERCPDPTGLFHRVDAAYSDGARGKVMGEFSPAVAVATSDDAAASDVALVGAEQDEVRETGSLTLSLGARPKLLAWLEGEEIAGSRLRSAAKKLVEDITALDRERLLAELRGDAGADREFARAVAAKLTTALREAGWQRGDGDRAALSPLFDLVREELNVDVLPGYLTYRRLRELQRSLGDQVKIDVKREGARSITLDRIGATWRDEAVSPLAMTWCTGPPPPYVDHLRKLAWFDAVIDGKKPPIEMSPGAMEAVRDFDSPDAQSLDGVVRSLGVLVAWLAADHPKELDAFTQRVKNAPELELDFFPLPGKVYERERLLLALDQAKTPDSLSVVRDAGREEGTATVVERIGIYREGRSVAEDPRAKFALKTLPHACEQLQGALAPVLSSDHVPGQVKAELRGLVTRMALVSGGPAQQDVELKAFKALLGARLIDPAYPDEPDNALHKAGVYLSKQLEAAGVLKVERFAGKKTIAEALAGAPADSAQVDLVFATPQDPELAQVRRPLVLLEGQVLQKAFLLKGVPTTDKDVLELDQVLTDTLDRVRTWEEGLGAVVVAQLDEPRRAILPRTISRIEDVRKKMFDANDKGGTVLPVDTALRDLIKFILDQVHRAEDMLAVLPDRSYRGAFGELVFKDIVFRSAGPYLSKKYNTSIDTTVVAGADTMALAGKFKKEQTGAKPVRESNKVFSVVVPCYLQDGVTIRPATVRVGEY